MTAPTVAPDATEASQHSDDDHLAHLWRCHDFDTAYCGADVTDVPVNYDVDARDVCIVCRDLARVHCGCECGCCDDCEATA